MAPVASGGSWSRDLGSGMSVTFNPKAVRVKKARLAATVGRGGLIASIVVVVTGIVLTSWLEVAHHSRLGGLAGGLTLLGLCWLAWLDWDLRRLPAAAVNSSSTLDQLLEAGLAARLPWPATSAQILAACGSDWRASFILVRLGLHPELITASLSGEAAEAEAIWDRAIQLAKAHGAASLDAGVVLAAIILSQPKIGPYLAQLKLSPGDVEAVVGWLERLLSTDRLEPSQYGGIGRDWAAGFTPVLDRFAHNLSRQIQQGGHHFGTLAHGPAVDTLITSLSGGAAGAAVIGAAGAGKTSTVYALAQRLIEGEGGPLAYRQIYSLSASAIVSSGAAPGEIEHLVLTVLSEAVAAGNVILALDEAQLFFSQGTGAVDLGRILMPIVESRRLPLILTLTPNDWQRLIASYPALTSGLTPVTLAEPEEASVVAILGDTALGIEAKRGGITTYSALSEAYRLSGRYLTEQAYPGRAIRLLELAFDHQQNQLITAESVQTAVERSLGVKVGQAQGSESDLLLNLESRIHERMINQTYAVSAVAGALRRTRAGVANPKRPVGSFLFLGPTGVGKTELARSLAAVYYGAETNLVRLDLSEYQNPGDVERLLAADSTFLSAVRSSPFSVVLLDELEKAHPNLLNLLLQLLDEGRLTDVSGRAISFKDAVVIATSNAGADDIRQRIEAGKELSAFEEELTNKLISAGTFKPELLNRFDEIVLFRPLNQAELTQVVGLLLKEVNVTLANQKISVSLTDAAIAQLVKEGYDPKLGARPMRRMVQRRVEDAVAGQILREQAKAGDSIKLDVGDLVR